MPAHRESFDAPAFLGLWRSWGFNEAGMPEDAAWHLHELLTPFRDESEPVGAFGSGGTGEQEFVLNCLKTLGLITFTGPPPSACLTALGEGVLAALDAGVHYEALVGGDLNVERSSSNSVGSEDGIS